jgi:hypothetical protein
MPAGDHGMPPSSAGFRLQAANTGEFAVEDRRRLSSVSTRFEQRLLCAALTPSRPTRVHREHDPRSRHGTVEIFLDQESVAPRSGRIIEDWRFSF